MRGRAVLLGERRRKDAAIILYKPEKWRQMALAWYYSVWRVSDDPLLEDVLGCPEGADSEAQPDLNPSLIRVVCYRDAMELSGEQVLGFA